MKWKAFIAMCTAASTLSSVGVTLGSMPVSYAAATTTAAFEQLLKIGANGQAVLVLQQDLNTAGYHVGKPDGIFGPGTEEMVKRFQEDHKLTADGTVNLNTWKALLAALGPTAADLHPSTIAFNGKLISSPQAFAWQGTTYMPIYYVMQLLKSINIDSEWDGSLWNLKVPNNLHPDLSTPPLNTGQPGDKAISLNGMVVAHMKSIVFPDPASGKDTTYMPIWYVMQALNRLPVKTGWDGKNWTLTKALIYYAYDKSGKELDGNQSYQTVTDAKQAVANVPGGTVKDNLGAVVYQAPDFTAYATDGKTVVGDYLTVEAAEAALANVPGGTVKDAAGKVLFTAPDFMAFTKGGKTVVGSFSTQSAAEEALMSVPGGIVKDSSGHTVFTEPDFAGYKSPTAAPQDFTTVSQAAAYIGTSGTGYVVNVQTNQVVQGPANYDYVNSNGTWYNSVSGSLGTPPSYAQPGAKYVPVTTSAGQSPQIYLISAPDGTYQGILEGSFENPFQMADLRFPAPASVTGAQIDQFLVQNGSPLAGLGQSFVSAQNRYGVDATYLVSHAILETAWGRSSIAQAKNNLFGYGAYDSNPGSDAGLFPTNDYAIRFEAWVVRNSYLEPTGQFYVTPTLDGMNVHYATDPHWNQSIASIMSQYVAATGGSASQYTPFKAGNVGPIPSVSQEPVFYVSGAQGTVAQSPYGSLPVFTDPSVGAGQMFPGTIQTGSSGQTVKQLQRALNTSIGAGLTVDGGFGPLTAQALQKFQSARGLQVTGVCDLQTWMALFPASSSMSLAPGATVVIDQMRQGMVGNIVTLWYHITASTGTTGWVDSQYVIPQVTVNNQVMTNLFRVHASSGYSIPVYASETTGSSPTVYFHNGDEVVTSTQYSVSGPFTPDVKGYISVQWVNQDTGQAMQGFLSASSVQLTPLS